jgi:hypothetical protein
MAILVVSVLAPLSPWLAFRSTRLTGGDFDGHVWTPWFLRHHVVNGKGGFGWTDQWFTGFPVLRYYFPIPAWLVAMVSLVIDPDVAFKVIVLASIAMIPLATAYCTRTAGTSSSATLWIAAGSAAWLLDPQYEILGGNMLSTMAGEYSYSLSVSLGLVFLASHIRSLRATRWTPTPGILCGLGIMTHVFPTAAAVVLALAWTLFAGRDEQLPASSVLFTRIGRTIATGLVALSVSAWWLIPFITEAPLAMIDIGWDRTTDVLGLLIPATVQRAGWIPFSIAQALAIFAVVSLLVSYRRSGVDQGSVADRALRHVTLMFISLWLAGAAIVCFVPQGRLWNERMLPWWVMSTWLLGGIGAARIQQFLLAPTTKGAASVLPASNAGAKIAALGMANLAVVALALTQTGVITAFAPRTDWGDAVTVGRREFGGWQARSTYAEETALVALLRGLGPGTVLSDWDPTWTAEAGELWMATIPIDTDGAIRSAEGVLYESSPSLPFLLQAQQLLTTVEIGSMRGLHIRFDPVVGATLAADLGINYLVVRSADVAAALLTVDGAVDQGQSGGFYVIELQPSPLVEPLITEPIVVAQMGRPQEGGWIDVAMASWVPWGALNSGPTIVSEGPASWVRGQVEETAVTLDPPAFGDRVRWIAENPQVTPIVQPTTVSNITKSPNGRVEFQSTRSGAPVKVRMPWSPRLRAAGADGPWRAGPNHIVIVPTQNNVRLSLHTPGWEWALRAISLATMTVSMMLALNRFRNHRRRR